MVKLYTLAVGLLATGCAMALNVEYNFTVNGPEVDTATLTLASDSGITYNEEFMTNFKSHTDNQSEYVKKIGQLTWTPTDGEFHVARNITMSAVSLKDSNNIGYPGIQTWISKYKSSCSSTSGGTTKYSETGSSSYNIWCLDPLTTTAETT
ncbi:hypothetical protein N9Y17_05140, partial [Gammaproteobacteria bacterium]|nr:hypothetical protein [Gammaproteobacteria bacterium]